MADDDTYVAVSAPTEALAIEFASSLGLVPLVEWADHYDVDVEVIEPGPPVRF